MKRVLSLLLVFVLFLVLPVPAFAAQTKTAKEIFNTATLTSRQSTNPTLAKYVKDIMTAIDPKDTMSTYDKTVAAYDWVAKNITFAKHYTLPVEVTTYIEDAAIYGFREGKGPCEVDSATLVYLFRYIGLDAQWTLGMNGSQYHWWTEVIIGNNIYAFDTYPGLSISFSHRTETIQNQTKVNGFAHSGYFAGGGPKAYVEGDSDSIMTSNVGSMDRMNPPLSSGIAKTTNFGDGSSFSWSIPSIDEKQMKMASIDKFYETTDSQKKVALNEVVYSDIAGKTLPVYTIKVGSNISMEGSSRIEAAKLTLVNGKLQTRGAGAINWDKETNFSGEASRQIDVGGGKFYYVAPKGQYMSFTTEGYYLVELLPWNKYCLVTDPKSDSFGLPYYDYVFKQGYFILHVEK